MYRRFGPSLRSVLDTIMGWYLFKNELVIIISATADRQGNRSNRNRKNYTIIFNSWQIWTYADYISSLRVWKNFGNRCKLCHSWFRNKRGGNFLFLGAFLNLAAIKLNFLTRHGWKIYAWYFQFLTKLLVNTCKL